MPTLTSGRFFVGRQAATTQVEQDGTFSLTLRVVDNQGLHANEPYLVRWRGPEAQAWWTENGPLGAGAALQLELLNPRAQLGLRVPEIHAQVSACRLLPPRAAAAQQQPAAQAS